MEAIEQTRRVPQRPPPPNASRLELEVIRNFNDLQKAHDIAHKLVNSGLAADERNDSQEALRCYTEGLGLIDLALRIDCETLPSTTGDKIDRAKLMQQKMTKTKQQITFRLQSLQREQENQSFNEYMAREEISGPPSYEEAIKESTARPEFMDTEMMQLGDSIMNDEVDRLHQNLTDASHLFSIESGVQIFYISPDGLVSAPSYPSSLHIVQLPERNQTFIHVNDWVYPLVPGSSPALQTNYGAYMFPDLMSDQHGAAVGLMLPSDVAPEKRQKFEQVVRSLTVYEAEPESTVAGPTTELRRPQEGEREYETVPKEQPAMPRESDGKMDTSTKISKGITVAAEWISWGLTKGAEKAGEILKAGSERIREKTTPSSKEHKVDPRIKKGLVYARKATHVTVQVTGYLVSKLGEATSALAKEIAPHIKDKGEKLLPKSVKQTDESGKSKLDGVVEVAASGLQGFGTVYVTLEAAAKILGKSLATETVSIIHHKYGQEAGQVAEHSMYTAGNAAMTAFNANSFGVKAVAKRAAKDTGKAVLEDMNKNKLDHRGYVSCENFDESVENGRAVGQTQSSMYPQIKR